MFRENIIIIFNIIFLHKFFNCMMTVIIWNVTQFFPFFSVLCFSRFPFSWKWEIFPFIFPMFMSIFPMLFFFLSERCHKPCTVLLRSGPRARSCQKKYFKMLHRQASIFPVFNFSRFQGQFFPFSSGQNYNNKGGPDLNRAPGMKFAAMSDVFQNVVPPFGSVWSTAAHATVSTGQNSNTLEIHTLGFHAV